MQTLYNLSMYSIDIYHGHTNFFVHVPSSLLEHLPSPLHTWSQSQWSAQHAPVGPFPSPFPQCPIIHVGVGLGVDELVVGTVVIVVVTPLFLHMYESSGT